MNPWLETMAVVILALWGVAAGWVFSRLKNPYWAWGYFIPLLMIAVLLGATYVSSRALVPVLAWLSGGRARFLVLGLSVTVGSMTLVGRLNRKLEKAIVLVLMVGVVTWSLILPFLAPALIQNELATLKTNFDSNKICFQSTDYTCAPAAAVTALTKLGFAAQEGQIAMLSHTSPVAGTLPWCLYKALANHYGPEGLECKLRHFDSVSELRNAGVTLAVVRDAFLLDHCVAVLDVTDNLVTIGDPVLGRKSMSHKQFEQIWRFYGIVLQRQSAHSS
jgi:hypothetical protein